MQQSTARMRRIRLMDRFVRAAPFAGVLALQDVSADLLVAPGKSGSRGVLVPEFSVNEYATERVRCLRSLLRKWCRAIWARSTSPLPSLGRSRYQTWKREPSVAARAADVRCVADESSSGARIARLTRSSRWLTPRLARGDELVTDDEPAPCARWRACHG